MKQQSRLQAIKHVDDFKRWARLEKLNTTNATILISYNKFLDNKPLPPSVNTRLTIFAYISKFLELTTGVKHSKKFLTKASQSKQVNPHTAYDEVSLFLKSHSSVISHFPSNLIYQIKKNLHTAQYIK